jgi:endonuclease/exonuclease/phosphatase family metal-dependent hydrolase
MTLLTVMSFNVLDLYRNPDDPVQAARYSRVEQHIRRARPDIVAVQELRTTVADDLGPDQRWHRKNTAARELVLRLAERTGLAGDINGDVLLGLGRRDHHVALLYRPDTVTAIPGCVRRYGEREGMWHSLITAVFDLSGYRLRIGSVHMSPFSLDWQLRDTDIVANAMYHDGLPGLVGGDFNSLSAIADPQNPHTFYDPDPYVGAGEVLPAWRHHLRDGQVDRRPAIQLERDRGLIDCAITARDPWHATTGHHPDDPHPDRRIDRWYHTPNLQGVTSLTTVDVGNDSDHHPLIVTLDTDAPHARQTSDIDHCGTRRPRP